MSYLVAKPEDRFSRDVAQMIHSRNKLSFFLFLKLTVSRISFNISLKQDDVTGSQLLLLEHLLVKAPGNYQPFNS